MEKENPALTSGAPMAASPVAAAFDPAGSCRVLVIEEDPSYRTTLTEMLQRHGYPVTAKASPEEGLRALRDNPEGFDLVMTVVYTQGAGIDGFELLKHAKELCPVILFSDQAPVEMVMRGLLVGASDILAKPLHDREIRFIWQHVVRWKLINDEASGDDAAQSSDVINRRVDTARKRGYEAVDDSDEGGSDGSQQQKQGRTTKKANFNASPQQHAVVVEAAEQLTGTEAKETVDKKEGRGEHVPPHCQDQSTGGCT